MFKQFAFLTTLAVSAPAVSQTAASQPQTTTSRSNTLVDMMVHETGTVEHGGFGAPVYKATSIDGKNVNVFGGRGAWMINRTYFLGGFGYGLTSEIGARKDNRNGKLSLGYGGILGGYNLYTDDLFHASFLLQLGAGQIGIDIGDEDLALADQADDEDSDQFSVIEPEVLLETNVTRYFRIGVGTSYRIARGVDGDILSTGDVEGWSGVLAFNFGTF
jgi:hypothetical protein